MNPIDISDSTATAPIPIQEPVVVDYNGDDDDDDVIVIASSVPPSSVVAVSSHSVTSSGDQVDIDQEVKEDDVNDDDVCIAFYESSLRFSWSRYRWVTQWQGCRTKRSAFCRPGQHNRSKQWTLMHCVPWQSLSLTI
jgi:hypothetical protein